VFIYHNHPYGTLTTPTARQGPSSVRQFYFRSTVWCLKIDFHLYGGCVDICGVFLKLLTSDIHSYIRKERKKERKKERNKQTNKETNKQTNKETNKQTSKHDSLRQRQ